MGSFRGLVGRLKGKRREQIHACSADLPRRDSWKAAHATDRRFRLIDYAG
jgi:hypothetical protein